MLSPHNGSAQRLGKSILSSRHKLKILFALDVLENDRNMACTYQEVCREKLRYTSVAIVEGVDVEEVGSQMRRSDQWVQSVASNLPA